MCVPGSPTLTRNVDSKFSMEDVYSSFCLETKVCSIKGVTLTQVSIDNVHHV